LGLVAAAGEIATALGVTPWQKGEAMAAAGWAFDQWIEGRGGTEPAEVRQAIEQVRLIIEQHGDARFDNLDDCEAKPATNRLGWRRGSGPGCEWLVLPQTRKTEVCSGLNSTMVAQVSTERGMLKRGPDQFATVVKIGGQAKRAFVLMAAILDGGGDAS
jgi:hypothetical protein